MNKVGCAAMVAATAALAAVTAEAKIEVSEAGQSYCYTPYTKHKDMSGITWAGGNKFYVIRNDNHLCVMTVSLDGNGNLTALPNMTDGISLEDASDPEGIAYDMASGKVWVSDEVGPSIREFDPSTGKRTGREVPIPPVLKKVRKNLSLESLTISPDGLTMWTANEEALTCDGNPSVWTDADGTTWYSTVGTVVRLVKFRRRTVQDAWVLDGMWAYKCNPAYGDMAKRCGVADLMVLPDNSLVVLERVVEIVFGERIGEAFLFRLSFEGANDVSDYDSLEDRTSYTPATRKCLCWGINEGWVKTKNFDGTGKNSLDISCYEGVCLGPQNSDGSINVMMVSDGGARQDSGNLVGIMKPFVRALKLTGLDVHTLSVNKPAPCGDPTFYGQNYRFVHNAVVTNELYGEGFEPRAYTNRGDLVYSSTWSLPAHGKSRIAGRSAVFNITKDDALTWNVSHVPSYASTPIYAHDTFEEYAEGTYGSIGRYWTGGGEVIEKTYTPSQGANKYILKGVGVDHKKVLNAEDGAIRSLPLSQIPNLKSHRMDFMVEVRRAPEDLPKTPTGSPRIALAVDKDGCLKLWHYSYYGKKLGYRWSKLGSATYTDGAWVRVGFEITNAADRAYGRVRVNGTIMKVNGGSSGLSLSSGDGQWFPMEKKDLMSRLSLVGAKVDDFILATPGYMTSIEASASIMVSPVAQSSGASGAAVAGGQAYTVATAVAAPAVATANADKQLAAPVITGFGIVPGGCPSIRFRGYAEGVCYRVLRSTSVDFKPENCECPEGEITSVSGDEAVWEAKCPDNPASGAKFYRVESIAE